PRPPIFPYTTLFRSVDLEWGDLRWILVVSIRHRQGRALPLRRSSVLRPLIHAAEVGRSVDFAGCECGHQSGFVPCRHRGLRRQAACQREWPNQYWRLRTVTATSGRRSEEHTSELQSRGHLVCRLLLEKKKI